MKLKIAFISKARNDAVRIVENEYLRQLKKNPGEINLKIKIFSYDGNPLHSFFQLFNIGNIWELIKYYKNYDIVHFSSFDNHYIIFNLLLRKIFNSKTILTVYHLEKDQTNSILDKMHLYKKILLSFDRYVAISAFTRDQLLTLGVSKDKITINPCGVSADFSYQKQTKKIPFRYLLYVGDEYPRKNLKTLLKAFSLLKNTFPDLKLVKIGLVKRSNHANILDTEIANLKLKNKVILIRRYMSNAELAKYYSLAELFITPSQLEGFGLPVAEAMRCGCIPLVSDIRTFREFNLPEELYVKDIKNPKNWAEKIKLLLGVNQSRKDRLRKFVYKISLRFSWQKFTTRIVKLYKLTINK